MDVGTTTFIVIIAACLGMFWMIQKAESCGGVLINAVLILIAGIAVIVLIALVVQYSGP